MEKEDALKIMMLKAEQQVNTIEFINKQLEVSNIEKQEFRIQVILIINKQLLALSNDNLTLRREKENLNFKILKYQDQIEHLQQEIENMQLRMEKQKQINSVITVDSKIQNQRQTPAPLFTTVLEQEYFKIQEDNSQQRQLLQELRNQSLQQQLEIQSIKFDNEKQLKDIKHLQDIIKSKDKHLANLEQQLKSQQELYQEKIDGLTTKLLLLKATLLEQPQQEVESYPESTLNQQYKEKYEQIKKEYETLLQIFNNQNEPVFISYNLVNISGKNNQ